MQCSRVKEPRKKLVKAKLKKRFKREDKTKRNYRRLKIDIKQGELNDV